MLIVTQPHQIYSLLYNLKVPYFSEERLFVAPVLSQINLVHKFISTLYSFKIHVNVILLFNPRSCKPSRVSVKKLVCLSYASPCV
jgi:hypothetical protein